MKIPVSSDIYLYWREGKRGVGDSQVRYSGPQHPECRHILRLLRLGDAAIRRKRSGGRGERGDCGKGRKRTE